MTHVITSVFSRAFQIYKQNKKLLAISDFFETPIRRLTVLYPTLSIKNGKICSQLWCWKRYESEICVEMHFSLVYKGLECIDLKEKNRKQKCDQIKKKIQSRVQKNFKCKSIARSFKKVLTYNTLNYKDIQQNSFFLFSKLAEVWNIEISNISIWYHLNI